MIGNGNGKGVGMEKRMLRVSGDRVVDGGGREVMLRGVGLGGWMNMENFVTGYPGTESAQRETIRDVLGDRLTERFFDRFLLHFFGEGDAEFVRSLGLNLVRLPVNYRHFEDDAEPFVIREAGFRHLDRVIDLCAAHGLYTIIDLHAAPGYQSQAWHCDNPTHHALLWQHKHFQDRTVNLWETIAGRYKGNPWVAGYNPINEPADPSGTRLMPVYERLFAAIRAVDPDHIIFLEGNRYSNDYEVFGDPWPNVVYSNHDYALPGFMFGGPYPGVTRGEHVDRDALERTFCERSEYMMRHGVPIWVGEFGPVYTGEGDADAMRFRILEDQLAIYAKYGAHWSIWTYKDIGLQGVVSAAADSPWRQRLGPFLEKKARLGADEWGGRDEGIRDVMAPLERLFAAEFPLYAPFPQDGRWQIERLVRQLLISEALLPEFGEAFRGIGEGEIDELMESFSFERCAMREELASILARFA